MTNIELAKQKCENFNQMKVQLYNISVGMYKKGYPISSIINQIHSRFYREEKAFTKTLVKEYVYKSICDFVMNENREQKQQGN